jgi:uncharacterized membrane protein YgdD (TMEM256/DUF423 family)
MHGLSHDGTQAPGITVPRALMLALGGLLLAAAVALDAWAAHAVAEAASTRLHTAARYLAIHGLGLLALWRTAGRWLVAASMLAVSGCLVFTGSLLASVGLGWSTAAAPWGGSLMILGWLGVAATGLRAAVLAAGHKRAAA